MENSPTKFNSFVAASRPSTQEQQGGQFYRALGELVGHGLKYTLRLVWKANLRRFQNQKPKTE